MKTRRKILYAVVGQGYFAQSAVLPAFKHSKNSELVALVSSDATKLKKLGKQYKVKNLYTYEQYDDLLRSGTIDAVYIALPNWMHRKYTERAAEAGIHILCEKPMAVTPEECDAMMRAAQHSNVKLMIAYRLHFEKGNLSAVDAVQKKIGEPRVFNSVFSFPLKSDNIRAKSEEIGGGPLHDIGVYCINASRYLFRDEPIEVFATSPGQGNSKLPGIHDTVSAIMKYPEGKIATFTVSFSAAPTAYYHVLGTKGDVCLENSYDYAAPMDLYLTIKEKEKRTKIAKRDQIAPELEYFSDCVLMDKQPEPSGYEGMIDVIIIQALLKSIKTGQPVPLRLAPRKQRPGLRQEIRKPPIARAPRLIRAEEPSKEVA